MGGQDMQDTNQKKTPIKKKTRGQTTCVQAEKRAAQKKAKEAAKKASSKGLDDGNEEDEEDAPMVIDFDQNNNPTGPWRKDFVSELGKIARGIKITYKTWKDVPGGKKDTIWLDLKVIVNI